MASVQPKQSYDLILELLVEQFVLIFLASQSQEHLLSDSSRETPAGIVLHRDRESP